MDAKSAIVLLSGGLDSATTLAIAVDQGHHCQAISFDYGQRHRRELEAAAAVARHYAVGRHVVMKIDLRAFGGSALTADIAVPKDRLAGGGTGGREVDPGHGAAGEGAIPITYVPARNTIFLSFALAFAETAGASDIFLGVNAVDYSGYPDCRPEFIAAFEQLANLATRAGVEAREAGSRAQTKGPSPGPFHVHTPLIRMSKAEIIRTGLALKVPYHLTHSCYDPTGGLACGHCDSCLLRLAGFKEAGAADPIPYANQASTEKGGPGS